MTASSPVDPNEVLMTGENSFVRLSNDGGKTMTDRASHWRVLWCPDGSGHALFLKSSLTDGQVKIWSDNPGVARWLQRTIESLLFAEFADAALTITKAQFTRGGDPKAGAWEMAVAGRDTVRLTWSNTSAPFVLHMPPGMANRPLGVFSTFFPARAATIEINGKVAAGQPWAEMRGDRQSSSACLAWSETWVRPRS